MWGQVEQLHFLKLTLACKGKKWWRLSDFQQEVMREEDRLDYSKLRENKEGNDALITLVGKLKRSVELMEITEPGPTVGSRILRLIKQLVKGPETRA